MMRFVKNILAYVRVAFRKVQGTLKSVGQFFAPAIAALRRGFRPLAMGLHRFWRWCKPARQPIARGFVKAFRWVKTVTVRFFSELRYLFLAAITARRQGRIGSGFVCFGKLTARLFYIHRLALRRAFNYLIIIAFIPVMFSLVRYYGTMTVALRLNVNGRDMGYIETTEVYEEAYTKLQSRVARLDSDQSKVCVPIYSVAFVSSQELMNADDLCDTLMRSTYDNITYAYGIYCGSDLFGVLPRKRDAQQVLNDYLQVFSDMYTDCEISFADPVTVEGGYYPEEALCSESSLRESLAKTTVDEMDYVAKEGDTYESIAELFDMGIVRFYELNQLDKEHLPVTYSETGEKQVGLIRPGEVFRVEYTKYAISLKMTYTKEYTAAVKFDTVKVADAAHYIGYSFVKQEGVTGSTFEVAKISYVYGIETEREVISTKVLVQKKDKILLVGTRASNSLKESSDFYAAKYYWPVQKVKGSYISAYYGDGRNHLGIDIAAPKNTEIYAGEDGTVTAVGYEAGGYGNYLRITHADGYQTFYAHCNSILVKKGDVVSRGDLIAFVGTTGMSTGNHLHFEVRLGGDRLDPYNYLGLTGHGSSIPGTISTEPGAKDPTDVPEDPVSSEMSSSDVSSSVSSGESSSGSDSSEPSASSETDSSQTVSSKEDPPSSSHAATSTESKS